MFNTIKKILLGTLLALLILLASISFGVRIPKIQHYLIGKITEELALKTNSVVSFSGIYYELFKSNVWS